MHRGKRRAHDRESWGIIMRLSHNHDATWAINLRIKKKIIIVLIVLNETES